MAFQDMLKININSDKKTCAMWRLDRSLGGGGVHLKVILNTSFLIKQDNIFAFKSTCFGQTRSQNHPGKRHQSETKWFPAFTKKTIEFTFLSETSHISLCTVQGKNRGMNECVLGNNHTQPQQKQKEWNKKNKTFLTSLEHFISSRFLYTCWVFYLHIFDLFSPYS